MMQTRIGQQKTMIKKTVIQFNNVQVTYKNSNQISLKDFSLHIKQGEFVVLTGKSGCGKTTVTRCINSLIPNFFDVAVEGQVVVADLDIKTASMRDISRQVGSVLQDPRSQFFTLHVKSELAFPSENYGIEKLIMEKKITKTVEELALNGLLERSLFELSSGEKQKVAVASIYALEPGIYVLDEPSANLDERGTEQLLGILQTLKAQGYTIIISEHRLCYLKDLVDRVVFMAEGQVKEEFCGKDFFKKPISWFQERGLRYLDWKTLGSVVNPIQDVIESKVPVLEAVNLSFGYQRGKGILENISLHAHSGEVIGIMGKNGIGKSTLLRVLMGLEKQRQGEIFINGKRAGKAERIQNSFYVMQDVDYQLFAPSVWEEMLLGLTVTPNIRGKAEKYLGIFGLEKYKNVHPASLSGGQKQRLAIALACMREAKLLFLDEPTSGLDGQNMLMVSTIIRELAAEGRCLFVISHDYEFAVSTFDKILYLSGDGEITNRSFPTNHTKGSASAILK